ncbi:MAG: hypothetical protein WCP11_00980 [Candidatus Saccharibacteria bacterium]
MKQITKQYLKHLVSDRYLLTLCVGMLLLATICAVNVALSIQPSDLKPVAHCSSFGITHLYRDQWYYLLTFVVFGLVVALMHTIISVKVSIERGRSVALMYAWVGIGIILLGWVTAQSVISILISGKACF